MLLAMKLPRTMKKHLACVLLLCLTATGCTRLKVISADKTHHRIKAGQQFTPEHDGWFVPDALWLEINEALERKY